MATFPSTLLPVQDLVSTKGALLQTNYDPQVMRDIVYDIYTKLNVMTLTINEKESGIYSQQEFIGGVSWYPVSQELSSKSSQSNNLKYRTVIRKVIAFGALPNTATKSVAHGIVLHPTSQVVRIYGAATDLGAGYIPIPFSSPTLNRNIEMIMDSTDIVITTGIDWSAYTVCDIVVEYIPF